MKKIIIVISIFLFFASLFISCDSIINQEKVYNPIKATEALNKLALIFTETLKQNPEFIPFIKAEASKMFDGDRDVLFDSIKNVSIDKGGKTLYNCLKNISMNKGETEDLDELLAQIPYLNIYYYIPEVYTDYGKFVVCSMRYDIDDQDPNFIVNGYDLNGNIYEIKGSDEPGFEAFVLGVNERIENIKYYQSDYYQNLSKGMGDGSMLSSLSIYLYDDKEGWLAGGADVRAFFLYAYKQSGSGKMSNIRYVSYSNDLIYEKKEYDDEIIADLFRWNADIYGQNIYVCYYDDDWGFETPKKYTVSLERNGEIISKEIEFTASFLGSEWCFALHDDTLFTFIMNYLDDIPKIYYTGNGRLKIGNR